MGEHGEHLLIGAEADSIDQKCDVAGCGLALLEEVVEGRAQVVPVVKDAGAVPADQGP
jgi:hypothetical protein